VKLLPVVRFHHFQHGCFTLKKVQIINKQHLYAKRMIHFLVSPSSICVQQTDTDFVKCYFTRKYNFAGFRGGSSRYIVPGPDSYRGARDWRNIWV